MVSFDPNIPLYQQIVSLLKCSIIAGELAPGEKLPPIRELAVMYQVTPNTIQRALLLLEQDRLIYTERTNGKYVTKDAAIIKKLKKSFLRSRVQMLFTELKEHGYTENKIRESIEIELKECADDRTIVGKEKEMNDNDGDNNSQNG